MLFSRRKRLLGLAEQEANGASYWTPSFEERARTRILYAYQDASKRYVDDISTISRGLILRDEGLLSLVSDHHPNDHSELLSFLLNCEDEMVPTVIEAMGQAIRRLQHRDSSMWDSPAEFEQAVVIILREHRISYDLVEGSMVEFSSKELHESLVAPTLRLLAGRSDLSNVESAYQAALEEISKGAPGDAITDAGTALQELLTALGCDGNSLGPLITSARKKGLLAAHDSPLLDAVTKILQWVSADRSQSGDSHSAQEPEIEDAWLIVHIVGAVVLRLAQGSHRG